jgi:putative DNA methylase
MEDNLRNRLQMFIGKFTDDMQQHLLHQKPKPGANNQLNDSSLIKWDNKNNETIINKARKLIWVSHNAKGNPKAKAVALLADFDTHYQAIKTAEEKLYSLTNRHLETVESKQLSTNLQTAIDAFLDKMPKVFDPFAGGGAIPLEAARLGCKSYGNDINPVAHIIQKGSLEFPQKYGKPITYTKDEFIKLYGKALWDKQPNEILVYDNGEPIAVNIANRLSFDVEFYAKKLLSETEKEIGYLYPADENGIHLVAYYWVRIGTCSNPTCKAKVPLLKQFNIVDTNTKNIHLVPIIKGTNIDFEIKPGISTEPGWLNRANLTCPCCGSVTQASVLKTQFKKDKIEERLLVKIIEGKNGKNYVQPSKLDFQILKNIPNNTERPNEQLEIGNNRNFNTPGWGIDKFGELFSDRQILVLNTFVNKFKKVLLTNDNDYNTCLKTLLAIWIDRLASRLTSFGIMNVKRETIEHPFGRQAIPMTFDYPESNPFANVGGGALNQLEWILRYIDSESFIPFSTILQNASSGEKSQFPDKYLTAVVTDPPYYDAIAYADISDFFYVWLKRTLGDVYPLNFATPKTPKAEECTALKHHHGSTENAKMHFENKLLQIFDAIEHQTSDLVSIMFAHQSTEAWTTLCNSILGARMNITGSWATDTELTSALKKDMAALSSSVTVSCKPTIKTVTANFKTIEKEIRQKVEEEVELLYSLGFRGADLLTACFGQAVSVFGNYQKVETAAGDEVSVAKLLEIAKEAAFNALLKGFDGDDFTKFYIGWLQLYGFAESDFDDAAKFSRVGLTINVAELFTEHILIKNGNKQTLGTFAERIQLKDHLGEKPTDSLIDQVHHAMALYKGTNRGLLLQFISKVASQPEGSFWRVVTAISEVLPNSSDDYKQAIGLNANKESLIRESKETKTPITEQTTLDF